MMGKLITTIRATITRIIFSAHSLIAIWQVTQNKKDIIYWTLCCPIILLVIEGLFTLAVKKNQEWKWFCPSVFLYLASVVPAIWLLELEKIDRRLKLTGKNLQQQQQQQFNVTLPAGKELGIQIKIDPETWITLIEQFLMLVLIVGRWMLPKGDLTRDQLSQLLLVYIGTAADIIEFFDSYKDDSIAKIPLLVFLTLGIWSWSLLQFTIVLSATRARKPRGGGTYNPEEATDCCNDCCCGIDVWGIVLNVILQDAPFLIFRLLIIIYYRIINYMNVFFTCKNTLVILLQLYRLYVVNSEYWKAKKESKKLKMQQKRKYKQNIRKYENDYEDPSQDIYIISSEKRYKNTSSSSRRQKEHPQKVNNYMSPSQNIQPKYTKSKHKKDKTCEIQGTKRSSSSNNNNLNMHYHKKYMKNEKPDLNDKSKGKLKKNRQKFEVLKEESGDSKFSEKPKHGKTKKLPRSKPLPSPPVSSLSSSSSSSSSESELSVFTNSESNSESCS